MALILIILALFFYSYNGRNTSRFWSSVIVGVDCINTLLYSQLESDSEERRVSVRSPTFFIWSNA